MLSTCNSQFFKQKDALDFCLHYCGLVTKLCPTLETHWAVARQTPLSMAFSRQDWSGLPFPSPGDLPNPGIKPRSPMLQGVSCIAGRFFFFYWLSHRGRLVCTGTHKLWGLICLLVKAMAPTLQCSCLENPRDGGAWWAAIYRVAQSRTRLKWFSGSSSRSACTMSCFNKCWPEMK